MNDREQEQINRLKTAKAAIKAAIISKEVSVPDSAKLDTYSTYIDAIKNGIEEVSTNAELKAKAVSANKGKVYKYTGTTDTEFTQNEYYKINTSLQIVLVPLIDSGTLEITNSGTYDVTHYETIKCVDSDVFQPRFICVTGAAENYASEDGINWVEIGSLETSDGTTTAITYGSGRFMYINNYYTTASQYTGILYYSTDGLNWTVACTFPEYMHSITYGNGRFVCVGDGASYYLLASGSDQVSWVAMSGISTDESIRLVTYGNGRFVCATFAETSFYSTNGTSWTAMTGSITSERAVTYGAGKFVLTGDDGLAWYSTNGTSWTSISTAVSEDLTGIAYGNKMFVAVGKHGNSQYSLDGITWIAIGTEYQYYTSYWTVCYGTGKFISIQIRYEQGESTIYYISDIYYLSDNKTWIKCNTLPVNYAYHTRAIHVDWRDY